MSNITHVAIGASSWRDYIFLAVPSALLWRDRIGFHPIILRTGDWKARPRGVTALRAIEEHKLDSYHVAPAIGYEEATMAQNCRQHVGCLDLPADDWAMPSDADLWPIRREFYQKHLDFTVAGDGFHVPAYPGVCYNANMDHYSTFPTCHVALKVGTWRMLYKVGPNQNMGACIKDNLDPWLATYRERWPWTDRGFAVWMSDQAMMTDKLRAATWFDKVKMVERQGQPGPDRIDRGAWPADPYRIEDHIDAHVFKAPDEPQNWPKVLDLFTRLLPQHAEWFRAYREEFIKGY